MTSDDDVRRLLAALDEHDRTDPPPVPEDVATRLDAQLAGLGREREEQEQVARVTPLRRRVRPSLAAAAAVVLVAGGAAIAGVPLTGGFGDQTSSEAGGSAAEAPAADEDSPSQLERSESAAEGSDSLRTPGGALRLQGNDLARQVEELVAEGSLRLDPGAAGQEVQSARVRRAGCEPPAVPGAQLSVRYDAERGTLVVRAAADGTRDVRVYSCSGDQLLDRAQVSAAPVPR